MTSFLCPFMLGISYIVSVRNFSTIERSPRAPVFCRIASFAISSIASSVNCKSRSSIAKDAWNCFVIAFFGSVRMFTRSSFVSSLRATFIGIRPISSGMIPNLTRSSDVQSERSSLCSSGESCPTLEPNPIECSAVLCSMILSSPTKAPPRMKRMFVVSI